MKRLFPLVLASAVLLAGCSGADNDLVLNDLEYFENRGANVLVFSNTFNGGFNDEKNSGIEIIHHGVRTVQGGAVRLCRTPEQWDLVPASPSRIVDREKSSIEVTMRYDDYDFESRVVVQSVGEAVEISVYLDKPVPAVLEGTAGFNLEFLPSQYWNKTFIADGRPCRFPRYAASNTVARPNELKPKQFKGFRTYDDRGTGEFVDPLPLETATKMTFAPEDPERAIEITADGALLELYDGRIVAQNGWYVLRSELPAGQTGKVFSWTVKPGTIPGWKREPNIGFSQVGYVPWQPKIAVVELDKADKPLRKAHIVRILPDGSEEVAYTGPVNVWGAYYKYNYVQFDFSSLQEPGIYYIAYGDHKTGNFIIDETVYDHITDATSDVWIPIHMNHMTVNEAYRIWHGEPFKEGYLQAPESDHFDLHHQGPVTSGYKPYQLIPGLNVGGFFDAGDFDIETGSNVNVVMSLIEDWDRFHPMRDETFVSEEQRYVDLHRPDGKPDILQYIEHGVLNLLAQAENIGYMSSTLSNSVLDNYHHLGDAAAITDGLHYDPSLPRFVVSKDGKSSGTPDDMWAFTDRNPMLDMNAANMFAAASRVLKDFDPGVAERCLKASKRLMKEASELMSQMPMRGGAAGRGGFGDLAANLQLYVATGEQSYLDKFDEGIWPALERMPEMSIKNALDAIPYMPESYKEKLRPFVEKYKEYADSFAEANPYGVPIGEGNWAGAGQVVSFGTTACLANEYFPDIIDKSYTYKVAAFMFGCHPYHNYSLVAAVGAARPKQVFYGNNRADFSFIPGNVAPGLLFRHPDHFENFDDWPFLWGQNEGTIAGNCGYLIFSQAFRNMAKD